MTTQNKRKLDNIENAQIWHSRLGHISEDRMKRLVDSKSLQIDSLDNLPVCVSCPKGKMTRKPFVGQSTLANGLLDLIHTDVCGPLNTQARGGFSFFIIFTNDHSRCGYVYLMRYKSEAFVRFKEFRLEVENQTFHKIKTLWSDQGGEYLSGEFIDYLKENGYYFYDPSEQKEFISRNAVFLERGFPTDTQCDELLLEESSEAPESNARTSSTPIVSTDNVPILCSFVKEEIYMDQSKGFTVVGEEQKNDFDPCVYKKVSGSSVVFLVLYVDDILLIGNDIKMLGDTKAWLSTQFSMEDLGEASYILGIKIFRDRSKRILGMTQNSYVEKVLKRFKMEHSKRGFLLMRRGVKLSKKQSPKTDEELKRMLDIPYVSAKEPRSHHRSKYILRRYHLFREMVERCDVRMDRVSSAENTTDPLTKPMSQIAHAQHLGKMGLRQMSD
ncbi:Retrovirus-related Pol polyprotein from transposon TNT 1-94 [Sesamum angolense]|uniref:Retrovirus-related Pol polyprotein from transposon TNT 1-94 n=1 Tax=Sesamum angolense TaxID=2727404 RepID=A0AAE1WBR9_9LAMI|nr:Retrovirus-related Pol polyprotein from transposon TNT 1-94 [Sesamum angolense]